MPASAQRRKTLKKSQPARGASRRTGKARAPPGTPGAPTKAASANNKRPPRAVELPQPSRRLVRGYAFDPQLSTELESVAINEIVYEVPWESKLAPGPRGDYLDVIDYDPASGSFYPPVDLDDRFPPTAFCGAVFVGTTIPSDFRCTALALALGLVELRCPDSGRADGSPVFRVSPWTRAALPTPRDPSSICSDLVDAGVAFAAK